MRRPLIGITGGREGARDRFPETWGHLHKDYLITAYAESVAEAGGLPVLLTRAGTSQELVQSMDGVLIAGGQDIDPRRYGQVPGPTVTVVDPDRDTFEIELVLAAVRLGRPVLGICRGMQLINVAFGGSLLADLPIGSGESHGFFGYPAGHRSQQVDLAEGSLIASLLGPAAIVNSYHHQAVDRLGGRLLATGQCRDGIVESLELPGSDLLGVQWHPELFDELDPVFGWLVDRSSSARTSSADSAPYPEGSAVP